MHHARFCKSRRLPLSLIILLAGAAWCTASLAANNGSRGHDQVTISGTPTTSVTAGQNYSFTPSATDSAGRALAFAIANMPSWASFSPSTGQLSGTPSGTSVGTYSNIVIAVSDGVRSATLPAFAVQVLAGSGSSPPPPPTISGTPATTDVAGSVYGFQPSASGPSGTTLSFSVQNRPAWATFSIATGVLSGIPSSTQTGSYGGIVISVSDGQASSALPAFTVTVTTPTVTNGSAVVAMVPPTENSNGSALTDLSGMRLYFGSSPSSLTQVVQLPGAAAPMSYTVNNLASGTWYFGATAYSTTGAESGLSAVASKTIP